LKHPIPAKLPEKGPQLSTIKTAKWLGSTGQTPEPFVCKASTDPKA
jgi:hypothetical protein